MAKTEKMGDFGSFWEVFRPAALFSHGLMTLNFAMSRIKFYLISLLNARDILYEASRVARAKITLFGTLTRANARFRVIKFFT